MAKKTWTEKLHTANDLPKIVDLSGMKNSRWGSGTMYIPSPLEIDGMMKKVRKGRLTTVKKIREQLALEHHTSITCPLTSGIFTWIAANAAEEMEQAGKKRTTPYWRTLKDKGIINPKYPGGIPQQKKLLEMEGYTVVKKGKDFMVQDFEQYC